jgi:hypothetical protein
VTITDCIFFGNTADYDGGGMKNSVCSPAVTGCTFLQNSADRGGGMFNSHEGNPTVFNCFIAENASKQGGGMYNYECSPNVFNCTFSENTAIQSGGGLWNDYHSSPTMTNVILWNDAAPVGPEIYIGTSSDPSTFTIKHSDVKGGQASCHVESGCTLIWGSGMIDADPLFVDLAEGDFHLTHPSPCRDTGDNIAVTVPHDFEGDPRIAWEEVVDMGADEFYTHLYCMGNFKPGGAIEGKLVGLPGTTPVGLLFGSGVLDPPLPTMWGDFHLQPPWFMLPLVPIPADGVLVLPATLPLSQPAPYDLPMQALIGLDPDSLSNLEVLEVR